MADKDEYYKEDKLTSGQKTKQFIWNPRTKEFLGRTGGSWAKLCVFYLIFYTCLAAFWAVMLIIFYQTIDYKQPKWTLDESRIGTNPGLGFRPRPPKDKIESTLIWFKSGKDNGNWQHWSSDLKAFIDPYEKGATSSGEFSVQCDGGLKAGADQFCRFDIQKALQGNCTKNDHFGYEKGTPCVLIKLNRIFNWMPKPMKEAERESDGKTKLLAAALGDEVIGDDRVYITCEGENPADKENVGQIQYFPHKYITANHFPFTNQPGYLSPFVFVQFASPARGILINVECKAWAKNINHNRMEREGSVHFELLID